MAFFSRSLPLLHFSYFSLLLPLVSEQEAENQLQEANIDRARLRTSNNQLETKLATSKLIENLKVENSHRHVLLSLQHNPYR